MRDFPDPATASDDDASSRTVAVEYRESVAMTAITGFYLAVFTLLFALPGDVGDWRVLSMWSIGIPLGLLAALSVALRLGGSLALRSAQTDAGHRRPEPPPLAASARGTTMRTLRLMLAGRDARRAALSPQAERRLALSLLAVGRVLFWTFGTLVWATSLVFAAWFRLTDPASGIVWIPRVIGMTGSVAALVVLVVGLRCFGPAPPLVPRPNRARKG